MLEQVNALIERKCSEKKQTYSPRVIGQLNETLYGDEMKLKEVLINILNNAVRYTSPGGRVDFSTEQIAAFQDKRTLRFIVRDTGVGISEEFLPKLFDAFSQEDGENAAQDGSTGLGLAITKSIVQLMNGEISVESKKGEGSTFTVTVTLNTAYNGVITDADDLSPDEENEEAPDTAEPDLEGIRVLIAEDVQTNAELLERILSRKGVEYELAENGKIAVDMFSESPEYYFDAILMDIRMPVMDGLQAARSIRSLRRNDAATVRIIAMTANAFDEDVQLSLQSGMNAHLIKPVDVAQLFDVLGTLRSEK